MKRSKIRTNIQVFCKINTLYNLNTHCLNVFVKLPLCGIFLSARVLYTCIVRLYSGVYNRRFTVIPISFSSMTILY
jgi:hypothetical protein